MEPDIKKRHPVITFSLLVLAVVAMLSFSGIGLLLKSSPQPTPTSPISPTPTPSVTPISSINTELPQNINIPILMYHYIRDDYLKKDSLGQNLSVTPANFDQQLDYLHQHNYKTMPLSDIINNNINNKPIIITFDDGYKDIFTNAFPLMKKYDYTGTIFVISDFVGRPEYMSLQDIQDLKKAGWEVGNHSTNHSDLSKIIAQKLPDLVKPALYMDPVFCYPSGKYNNAVIKTVSEASIKIAVTTEPGIYNTSLNKNLYELPRVRISNGDNIEKFAQKIQSAT